MKKTTSILFSNMGSSEIKILTTIVDETLAISQQPARKRNFSTADLWNIQSQKRTLVQRRSNF